MFQILEDKINLEKENEQVECVHRGPPGTRKSEGSFL